MVNILNNNFWLICSFCVAGIGTLGFNFRLSKAVASGHIDNTTKMAFLKGWLLATGLPCLCFWAIQLTAVKVSGPEYMSWPSPQKWIAAGFNVACWIALLWWIWLGNGATTLSKLYPYLTPKWSMFLRNPGPTSFKILSLLIVASGLIALAQPLT